MRLTWTPKDDAALLDAARCALDIPSALVAFARLTGVTVSRQSADARLRKTTPGTTLASLIEQKNEIPIEWEDDGDTLPGIVAAHGGHGSDPELNVDTCGQVPADCAHEGKVGLNPCVNHSEIPKSSNCPEKPEGSLERVLIIPDCHIPYEDGKAFATMMAAARFLKPDTIVILGDFADMLAVSSHDKSKAEASVQLKGEMEAVNARLDEVDALGATRKVFTEGNHCTRAQRLASKLAIGLWDSLSTEHLLRLPERGWEFVPYRQHARVGKLYVTHDTGIAGMYAHSRSGAAFENSVAHGHTHRAAVSYFGSVIGETHVAAMLGWLGDRAAADYLPEVRKKDWQHGFGVAYVERDTQNTHLSFVPIINGRCVVEGRVISYEDRMRTWIVAAA